MKINCGVSDGEEGPVSVVFTKSGTLGELIREIRLTLRIMPTDKATRRPFQFVYILNLRSMVTL